MKTQPMTVFRGSAESRCWTNSSSTDDEEASIFTGRRRFLSEKYQLIMMHCIKRSDAGEKSESEGVQFLLVSPFFLWPLTVTPSYDLPLPLLC